VHAALERWFGGGLREDPGALFDLALAEGMAGIRPGLDDRATAARAREAVLAFCRSEAERTIARRWKPVGFEVPFGSGGRGEAGPLVLRAGGRRVEVRGRLDRLDRAPDGSAIAVDYKMRWKERPFDEKEFEKGASGEDPQPFVYWLALRDAFGLRPAGVEFAQVGARTVSGLRAADAPESVAPDEPRVLDAEGAAAVERAVRDAAGRAAAALARGLVPARPNDPDRCGSGRCDYADLCRFEKWDPRRGG
jgi:hypothetical protein